MKDLPERRDAPSGMSMGLLPRTFVLLCWSTTLLVAPSLWRSVRGTFEWDAAVRRASATLIPKERAGQAVRLDTATALVLVYSAKCTACQSNTDNWVRLVTDLRAKNPAVPVYLVAAPPDSRLRTSISPWLSSALHEYLLPNAVVDSALGVGTLPSTVVLRRGLVLHRVSGVIGPKRRERILESFATEGSS